MEYLLELFKRYVFMVWSYLYSFVISRSSSTKEQHDKISNMQGICGDIWEGSEFYIGAFEVLFKKSNLLNRNQCINLYKKIEHVTKIFDQLMTCTNDGLQFGPLLKNCGNKNWGKEAIFQLNN
uniref:Uncharacterized protein n=1 Tax=Physcomitrium patens TaxID=3218 RepID=A0A7I4EDX0_PHYPA